MKKYLYLLMVAVFATLPFSLTSCGDDDDEDTSSSVYGKLNVNSKDYACYGFGMPITYSSTWENNELEINLPLGELSDAQKGEYDYDYMYSITCSGGSKPTVGTNLGNYSNVSLVYMGGSSMSEASVYCGGSAIVKEVSDDAITIEFKDFTISPNGESSLVVNGNTVVSRDETFVFNGTVKLDYDID